MVGVEVQQLSSQSTNRPDLVCAPARRLQQIPSSISAILCCRSFGMSAARILQRIREHEVIRRPVLEYEHSGGILCKELVFDNEKQRVTIPPGTSTVIIADEAA